LIDDSAGPVVSLSHSQKYTIVAVANSSAIGVDLEVTRPKRYAQITEYLNWRSFAPRFPVDPGADEFFHFWTLWEAGLKASTIGNLFRPNEPFRTLADRVRAGESGEVEVDGWYTRSWTFPGAFWITLITRSFCRPTVRLCVMDEPRAATPFNSRACDLGLF
jgi:phosphopantetheinyl transferase